MTPEQVNYISISVGGNLSVGNNVRHLCFINTCLWRAYQTHVSISLKNYRPSCV